MPLLVLFALAGIIGYAGYGESAKIETRFRRGPLGIRSRQWGVGAVAAGLVVGLVAPALVVGALLAYVGYDQTSRYDEQHGGLPFDVPPLGWAVAGFCLGAIGAIFTSAFAVGAMLAFVGCNEAAAYERQFGRQLGVRTLRAPAQLWGVPCFFVGLVGALVTSTSTWGVACSSLALAGALALLVCERNTLIAAKAALIAEKEALLAERSGRRPAGANGPGAPAAAPAASPAVAKPSPRADAAPRRPVPPRQPVTASGWPGAQPAAPRPGGAPNDLLPHRR